MATLLVAPTRHCHTNQFGGILTNQHLPGLDLKREDYGWEKTRHKMSSKQQGIATTVCKEL